MANTHHTPAAGISQEQHHFTVGYVPNGGYGNNRPSITIKGRWLEKAGFTQGTPICVTLVGQHLVITPQPRRSLMNEPKALPEDVQEQLNNIISLLANS